MAKPRFEPITDMTMLYPRDYPLADPTVLTSTSNPLIEGEWLRQTVVGTSIQLQRPSGSGIETNPNLGPWWGERGRYDVFQFGGVPILWLYDFEAYTLVCDTTGLTTNGQKLSVNDVTVEGIANRRGLKLTPSGVGNMYVGYYISPGRTTGEIRFVRRPAGFTVA